MQATRRVRATKTMIMAMLVTGGCGSALAALDGSTGPGHERPSPRIRTWASDIGDTTPHGNARRRRSSHAAFGPAPAQTGQASYYHDGLQGRRTSSGERYDRHGLTAAHRTLPLGTLVRVTNLVNLRSVMVRVNDRGPFIRNRLIDLSRAAADRLGYRLRGSAPVAVEVVDPATADDSPTSSR